MKRLRARAPGKVNLCLLAGAGSRRRAPRGRDRARVGVAVRRARADGAGRRRRRRRGRVPRRGGPESGHRCAGRAALAWLGRRRACGSRSPSGSPWPAGMGGGSADAAAALRLAEELPPVADEVIAVVAAELGSDVPSQLVPGRCDRDRRWGVGRGGAAARTARVRGRAAAVRAVDARTCTARPTGSASSGPTPSCGFAGGRANGPEPPGGRIPS